MPTPRPKCALCHLPSTMCCSRCKARHFCSQTCQRVDWAEHRKACSTPTASATADNPAPAPVAPSPAPPAAPLSAPLPPLPPPAAPPPPPKARCSNCSCSQAPLRCTNCKQAWYCCAPCQRANWKDHKSACKAAVATQRPFEESSETGSLKTSAPLCSYCLRPVVAVVHSVPCCSLDAYCSPSCQSSDAPRHSLFHGVPHGRPGVDWVVRSSPTHGMGVFALRAIPAHYRLLVDKFLTKREATKHPNYSLLYPRSSSASIDDKWNCNAFEDTSAKGSPEVAALNIAMINHACLPNCALVPLPDVVAIVTMTEIREGEEITFSYRRLFDPTAVDVDDEEHRDGLYGRWEIECPDDCACRNKALLKRSRLVKKHIAELQEANQQWDMGDREYLSVAVEKWQRSQEAVLKALREPPFNSLHYQKSLDVIGVALFKNSLGRDKTFLQQSLALQRSFSYPDDPVMRMNAESISQAASCL